MPGPEEFHRRELIAHHRRTATTSAVVGAAWLPLLVTWRVRRARYSGDPWAWAAVASSVVTPPLVWFANYRRAERAAEQDLAMEAQAESNRARIERGEQIVLSSLPAGQTWRGCMAQGGLLAAGVVQALWDYRQRPDVGRRVADPRWRLRPGPAWWTAWSWQQLPVNAASTAPRSRQIAYERRQILTLQTTGTLGTAIGTWQTQLSRALAEHDRLMLAVGTVKIVNGALRAVADYRGVPSKVDGQRARRRRHDAAVAALVAARATGRPGPANPWRGEMLLSAATIIMLGAGLRTVFRTQRRKPRPPQG